MMRSSNGKAEEDMRIEEAGCGASLPHEMIMEVLKWLPVTSVLRFRSVCRSWAALLSTDEFRSLHMAARRAPSKLLYIAPTARYDCTAVYTCPFSPPPSSSSHPGNLLFTIDGARGNCVEVVTPAPCRGLILLYDAIASAYYICNPATRAATRLPPSTNLASRSTTGLGFDARTKEYKVVRLINGMCSQKDGVRCEVYTPGGRYGDCWRPVAGGVPSSLRQLVGSAVINASLNKLPPVFANGFLHWLMDPTASGVAVISFSITEETFGCISSPPFWVPEAFPDSCRWSSAEHLVEIDSRLCIVRDLRDIVSHDSSSLEIWQLLDYSSGGWSLNHRINFSGQLARDLRQPQIVRVIGSLGRSSRKKIIIATSNHKIDNMYEKKVHTYDTSSEAVETILSIMETHSSPQYEPPSSRFSFFEETFAPVHKTDEEIASSCAQVKATSEILLRLPAKSAIHSKLVCKQWLRLIENQNFIESYFKHKNTDRGLKVMLVGKGTGRSCFSFAPLNIFLRETASHSTLLDRKVVCSKPCHGLNLISTETEDYLCNPCTGFHRGYANQRPNSDLTWRMPRAEEHAFTVGNKNVGLTFDPLTREHVLVELFYHSKNFKSRQYYLTCALRWCSSQNLGRQNLVPPLPVNDMPPAYLDGVLYWMSEPRLGQSYERAIISFDIATNAFGVIACPPCIAMWNRRCHWHAFVVELEGVLCAILADPIGNNLDIWKLKNGEWDRAYIVHLEAWPDYSLETNVVVPLAVDPNDGRILLNTGKKLGFYDPVERAIQNLYSLDGAIACSKDQSAGELNRMDSEIWPLVPMLYEENLWSYPLVDKPRWL